MQSCQPPAALKTRSTPAEDAGEAKYCLTILARLGHFVTLTCHDSSQTCASVPIASRQSVRGVRDQDSTLGLAEGEGTVQVRLRTDNVVKC